MAGRLINIIPMSVFNANFVQNSPSVIMIGNRFYDVREASCGVLLVRVAAKSGTSTTSIPTGGNFTVAIGNVLVMPDDPLTTYAPPSSATPVAQVQVLQTDSATWPRLYTQAFTMSSTTPAGAQVQIALVANYGSAAALGTICVAVDVLARDSS